MRGVRTRGSVPWLGALVSVLLACGSEGVDDESADAASASAESEEASSSASSAASESGSSSSTTQGDGDGDGDGESETDTGTDTTSTSDGGGLCTGACVDTPDGWQGPVNLFFGITDPPFDCGPGSVEVYFGRSQIEADSYECETCTCDGSDVSCADVVVRLFDDTACDGTAECSSVNVSQETCTPIPDGCAETATRFEYAPDPAYVSGTCTPVPADPTPTLPPAEWRRSWRACAATNPDACVGSGTCAPPDAVGAIGPCVWTTGQVACPPDYPQIAVTFSDFDDTRGCSACACGSPQDPCELDLKVTDATCAADGSSAVGYDADKCKTLGSDQSAAYFDVFGACEPSGGEATGQLSPSQPTTFCCAAP